MSESAYGAFTEKRALMGVIHRSKPMVTIAGQGRIEIVFRNVHALIEIAGRMDHIGLEGGAFDPTYSPGGSPTGEMGCCPLKI